MERDHEPTQRNNQVPLSKLAIRMRDDLKLGGAMFKSPKEKGEGLILPIFHRKTHQGKSHSRSISLGPHAPM